MKENIKNVNGPETINAAVFRPLKASEVTVRPAEVKKDKATLLLYQDARCAQNILDDTVGPFNWQKEYYDSHGLLFCKIGIRDEETGEWVWKSDTGSESNIESDKGLASDAFKRASVAWGIGRELYTAPRIQVSLTDKDFYNGKLTQQFKVAEMTVEEGTITSLTLCDKWGNERFTFSGEGEYGYERTDAKAKSSPRTNTELLTDFCTSMKVKEGVNLAELTKFFKYYTGPSKDKPNTTIIETWNNPKPEKMWERWDARSRAS